MSITLRESMSRNQRTTTVLTGEDVLSRPDIGIELPLAERRAGLLG